MAGPWLLQQSLDGMETYFGLAERTGGHTLILNQMEALDAAADTGSRTAVVPRLAIPDVSFRLDLFEDGLTFVSSRLLEAMALPAGCADVGEVDAAACPPEVRGMNYRTLSLTMRVDALDRDESEGSIVEWVDGDGVARSEWMLTAPQPNRPTPRARWRRDLRPPADLFLVAGTSWRAATDALAARVMAIGATGLDFVDPVASAATGDLVSRPR
ncbi:hypothetical protein [Sphingomonas sp. CFBP 8760]|uniref:hypothetical protein n=1 Tax=Sphingomonas sp. CFBP 8760 TaxID=2775282 RepID=UPI00177D96EF|nr:hypothetical protein [Sphingomonas sp. CFBP 8760]MBD8546018.1 hypothetical protein [Sphingomonas sp. CFBP 8760]